MSTQQERLRARHFAQCETPIPESPSLTWEDLEANGLEMMVTSRSSNEDHRRIMSQKEVLEAIKAYAEAALDGDAGPLWDVVPDQEVELMADLRAWIVAFK